MNPQLKIKKLFPDAQIPIRKHPTDSGLDLYAYKIEQYPQDIQNNSGHAFSNGAFHLAPGDRALINTGVSATVGAGYEIQIRPRSGMALKSGLTVLNTPGTIDESYRGPISVILINLSKENRYVERGTRIAQMVVCPVILCSVKIVAELEETQRGANGFGSTGE